VALQSQDCYIYQSRQRFGRIYSYPSLNHNLRLPGSIALAPNGLLEEKNPNLNPPSPLAPLSVE